MNTGTIDKLLLDGTPRSIGTAIAELQKRHPRVRVTRGTVENRVRALIDLGELVQQGRDGKRHKMFIAAAHAAAEPIDLFLRRAA